MDNKFLGNKFLDNKMSLYITELKNDKNKVNMDQYLGIAIEMKTPVNLFLNTEDLLNIDKPNIKFFAYSFGLYRIVFWGYYQKLEQNFVISNSCNYNTNDLKRMLSEWKYNSFDYISNIVVNRPRQLINSYLDNKMMKSPEQERDEYILNKYLLNYFSGKITMDEFNERYDSMIIKNFIAKFERKYGFHQIDENTLEYIESFNEVIDQIRNDTIKYEKSINRRDINQSINRIIYSNIFNITERFYDLVKSGKYYVSENQCPRSDECVEGIDGMCDVYFFGQYDL